MAGYLMAGKVPLSEKACPRRRYMALVQRLRRERWYRNEVGDQAAEFHPVEEFRR